MDLTVAERFWTMDNRFWIVFDPDFTEVGSMVIGFMPRTVLCCDSAEPQLEHPCREVDKDELMNLLRAHDAVVIWDMLHLESLGMTRRADR